MKCCRALLFLAAAVFSMDRSQAQNVITVWNTIESTTIVANGGKASLASRIWFAYTFVAVYDAVNAVHRMYQLCITTALHQRALQTRRPQSPPLIACW